MIEVALVQFLKSNLSVDRIFPQVAPLDTDLPCVTVDLDSEFRNRHWGTDGTRKTGMVESDFELSCWGNSQLSANTLAKEIVQLLENYQGPMSDAYESPSVTHRITDIEITGQTDGFDKAVERYGRSIFISISHK